MAFLTQHKRMLRNSVVIAAFALSVLNSASADIVDVPFGIVNVAGENYSLNFTYYDGPTSNHTFNGLGLTITFTTQATAEAARQAIIDMYLPNDLPTTAPPMAYQGFYIPYEADATHFSHVIAYDHYADNVWDSWDLKYFENVGRNDSVRVAAAEFTALAQPAKRADVTGDDFVGADDLVRILTNWGESSPDITWADGDCAPYGDGYNPGDDFVGADDYVEVLTWWATDYSGPEPAPEPASLILLTVGGLALLKKRVKGGVSSR